MAVTITFFIRGQLSKQATAFTAIMQQRCSTFYPVFFTQHKVLSPFASTLADIYIKTYIFITTIFVLTKCCIAHTYETLHVKPTIMGLKSFLQQQGFITDDGAEKPKQEKSAGQTPAAAVTPMFFPVQEITPATNTRDAVADPSFVTPLQQNTTTTAPQQLDPSFVKFFEDELVKSNLEGPDYFEFRQLLSKTQQKMAAKGVNAADVVLQTVLMSFEAQDITSAKLVDAAKHYKEILKQKNDDFLKGAAAEKNNQLQKRQAVLQTHTDNIKKIQAQIQQLEQQKQQLEDTLTREQTQLEADKSIGREGIEKIERAEQQITLAHTYIQSTIDTDINRLKSV